MRSLPFAFAMVLAPSPCLLAACDPGAGPTGTTCETRADCEADELCLDGLCEPSPDAGPMNTGMDSGPPVVRPDAGPPRTLESLRIEPATATLVAADGDRPTQTFEAIFVYSDGSEAAALGPSFALDRVALGDLDLASGVFVANGLIGGTATVTATVPDPAGGPDRTATAALTVRLERTLSIDPAPVDAADRFAAASAVDDAPRAAGLVYPLDGVVMPQNVYPADVQWTNGAADDLFRVTIAKPSATITAYVPFDGMNHWLVDLAAWRAVAQSDPDASATLTVDRLEAASGEVVRGAPIAMTFARAALTGTVYYWNIVAGRIERIDDGSGEALSFMPSPPLAPTDGNRCVGCHTVSNSGRYMAGRLGGGENQGALFDLTTDLSGDPAPTVWPISTSTQTWWFSSWSPDDRRLVIAFHDHDAATRQLRFIEPLTGAPVPITGTPPSGTQPAWSPDGTRIAYVANANTWGGEMSTGDIAVLPMPAPDTVGTPTVIHTPGSIPGHTGDSYPTWSPDSAVIAFASGAGARSERDASGIYIMQPDGTAVAQLARASASERIDYQPRFSPFQQGGYYWLSFLSRRVYGNPQIGNTPQPVTRRQQIWVTAVRVGAPPGEDPSAVPYWLPGQNPRSANISAFWAPRPCRPDGEGCSVGSECCGGDCRPPAGGGEPVCSPPPPDRCRSSGETCSTDADCCPDLGLSCLGHVCVAGPG